MKHVLLLAAALCSSLAYAQGSGRVFISSEKDNAVIVLDGQSLEKVATIKTGKRPRWIQFNADKTKLYVAASESNRIDIIDVASLKLERSLKNVEDPEIFDLSADGQLLYISYEDDAEFGAVALNSGQRIAEVKVGEEPEGVKTSPDGKTIYVTSEVANMVHVIDAQTYQIQANIVVENRPRRFAITPDGQQVWVTNELSGSVSVIDAQKHTVIDTIRFQPKGFRPEDVTPVGIIFSPDSKTAYVALGRANHVAVVDIASRSIKQLLLVGKRAWGLGLSRDGSRLWVTNGLSDDVSLIDTQALRVLKSIPVARVPHSVVVDD